jgi:hypothetical protein
MNSYIVFDRCPNKSDRCLGYLARHWTLLERPSVPSKLGSRFLLHYKKKTNDNSIPGP